MFGVPLTELMTKHERERHNDIPSFIAEALDTIDATGLPSVPLPSLRFLSSLSSPPTIPFFFVSLSLIYLRRTRNGGDIQGEWLRASDPRHQGCYQSR